MVEEREGSAEPLPVSEQSALADPGYGATTATAGQEGGAGNSPEGNDDVHLTSKLLSGETAPSSGFPSAPPILTVPVVAVPCFLAPAALIESPGFTALGQLAIAHPAVLATVTTQAHVQMQTAYSPSGTMTTVFPHPRLPTDSSVSSQQTSPVAEISSGDVYHWRKYGQKQVKNTENFRSYYRCANSNCLAKKKVECSPEGKICEVIYRGKHDHDPPQKNRNSRERGSQSAGPSKESGGSQILRNEPNEIDPSACKNNPADETPDQQLHRSIDCERDARIAIQKDLAEEPDPKRRLSENSKSSITPRHESSKTVREYIVQSETDSKKLGDGYRWRKYGQKFVKGNPNPRSYYRCTHDGCPVRKHVERASHDAKALLITYEGKHNHYQPRGPILKCANDQVAKESPVPTAGKEGDAASSLLAKISSEDMNPNDTVKKLAGDKVSEFGGDKSPTPSCAQSLTNVEEDGERIEPDGMRNSLLNGNPAAVQVKNS